VGMFGVLHLFSHWRTQVVLTEEQGVFLDMRKAAVAQINCEQTVRTNLAACDNPDGELVSPVNDQSQASNWFQPNNLIPFAGQSYKLRARCQKLNDGVYSLDVTKVAVDPEDPDRLLPSRYARFKGQTASWDSLTALPLMCRPTITPGGPRFFSVTGKFAKYRYLIARQQGLHSYNSFPGEPSNFLVDQTTITKVCEVLFTTEPGGACRGTVSINKLPPGFSYQSPGDNFGVRWNGSNFQALPATDFQANRGRRNQVKPFWDYNASVECRCSGEPVGTPIPSGVPTCT